MDESDKDYEVGFGKPPMHTRFKPGQSGNPKGRPKNTKDLEKLMDRELSRSIRVNENGQSKTVTIREAINRTIVVAAAKGDSKALRMILPFMSNQTDLDGFEVDPAGEAMLKDLFDQFTPKDGGQHADQG
ncbi:MAG: DUF5681 domain-containing protein [Planctomycetota bacterium]